MKRSIFSLSLFLVSLTVLAQDAGAPRFEVASVRRDPTTDAGSYVRYLPGGRLSASSWMKQVVQLAYGMKDYQVTGGPGWLTTDWYTIEARAGRPDATKDEINAMLQTLLVERFHLKFHREVREMEAYDLVVDKGEAKLTPLGEKERSKCARDNSAVCGMTNTASLAGFLTSIMRHPVFDKTGITGRYDVLLDFDTYALGGKAPPEGYSKPALSTALQEQLGLRLERHKEPMPVLVVDGMERPTEN